MKSLLLLFAPMVLAAWVPEMENEGLHEGDMILSPEQLKELKDGKFSYGSIKKHLWPKKNGIVEIPYYFAPAIQTSRLALSAIQSAFADYHKYTCLRFVPWKGEPGHIYFYVGSGCSSPVGYSGRQNRISLSTGCWARSTAIHEIGHSIGFHHEQSRPDRDSYLRVRWENVPERLKFNFQKMPTSVVDSLGTPYDYLSVMHYGRFAFGRGKVTMDAIQPYYKDLIGTVSGFSDTDVKQVNLLYNCPPYKGIVNKRLPTPNCHDKDSYCEKRVIMQGCTTFNKKTCPFTCNECTGTGGTAPIPTMGPGTMPSTPPPTKDPNPNCKNIADNCDKISARCKDGATWIDFMRRYCVKTCGYC